MAARPVVFLGSSTEARQQTELVMKFLSRDAYVIPWYDAREFGGLAGNLEALMQALARYDFAVFLLTPDDKIESRGERGVSARDNVLFEAGLFLGAIGRERVEILVQRNKSKKKRVKIPSDLSGVDIPGYEVESEAALDATLNNSLGNFRDRIRRLGRIQRPWRLIEGWEFDLAKRVFSMTLGAAFIERSAERLIGMAFFVVVRKTDPDKDLGNDKAIIVSTIRKVTMGQALKISVSLPETISLQTGDQLEGHLFGVPTDFKIGKMKTIDEFKVAGADSIDGKALGVR